MTAPTPTSAWQPPFIRVMPPEEAYDFEYYRARLVRSELLRDAVALVLYRIPLLAVPTGPSRRGGQLHMATPEYANQAAQALNGRWGFNGLTTNGPLVSWGEPIPQGLSPHARRRFHGLREQPRDPAPMQPPAGHDGGCLAQGRRPTSSEPPSGRPAIPRAVVQAGAAHAT
ncbi:DUF6302 family protein [Streptomyces longwoodensis]|uniref:DUF6302 family protein n=1 Tax=Streptomyces longwoodensis TaxID=68231 RepID=UPI0036E62523